MSQELMAFLALLGVSVTFVAGLKWMQKTAEKSNREVRKKIFTEEADHAD